MAHRCDRTNTHRGVEDLVVLGLQARRVDDVTVLGDELDDRLDLLLLVAQLAQRPRDRLVHDLHRTAADELLELDQREVRLDAGGVAVHHEADGVMADEAGRHVGDVLGHGDVERRLDTAIRVLGDSLEDVLQREGQPVIRSFSVDLLSGLPGDATALAERALHHSAVLRGDGHDLVPHLTR